MDYLQELKRNETIFLKFMQERYPIYTNSNIFLRDLQFGIQTFFERKDIKVKYPVAEELAFNFASYLEEKNDLQRLDDQTWKVLFSFDEPEQVTEEEQNSSL